MNKSELGRDYGVSHTTIGRDFDRLAEYIAANLDRNHTFIMDRVMRGALRNLVEDGEHYKAVKAAEKWYDWLADAGEVTREPERRELDMDATMVHEQTETESSPMRTKTPASISSKEWALLKPQTPPHRHRRACSRRSPAAPRPDTDTRR